MSWNSRGKVNLCMKISKMKGKFLSNCKNKRNSFTKSKNRSEMSSTPNKLVDKLVNYLTKDHEQSMKRRAENVCYKETNVKLSLIMR
jgi:hypothetical protein